MLVLWRSSYVGFPGSMIHHEGGAAVPATAGEAERCRRGPHCTRTVLPDGRSRFVVTAHLSDGMEAACHAAAAREADCPVRVGAGRVVRAAWPADTHLVQN